MAGAAVGIGVEEALHGGVIISALQVIEARLLTIVLSVYRFRRLFFLLKNRQTVELELLFRRFNELFPVYNKASMWLFATVF